MTEVTVWCIDGTDLDAVAEKKAHVAAQFGRVAHVEAREVARVHQVDLRRARAETGDLEIATHPLAELAHVALRWRWTREARDRREVGREGQPTVRGSSRGGGLLTSDSVAEGSGSDLSSSRKD